MSKIGIITDDSMVMLPEIDSWTGKVGRGQKIIENDLVIQALQKENMDLPSTDLEKEPTYKRVLSEFVRPAKNMFAGSFAEIRSFSSLLDAGHCIDLCIVSSRYGLIHGNAEIVPYYAPISDLTQIEELERRHGISEDMLKVAMKSDFLIISFPSYFVEYLVQNDWFDRSCGKTKIIMVCASSFRRDLNDCKTLTMFDRIGVARLGKTNQHKIIEIVNS